MAISRHETLVALDFFRDGSNMLDGTGPLLRPTARQHRSL